MITNKNIIYVIVFFLFFLSSCTNNNTDVGEIDDGYKFGTKGVTIDIENLNRYEMFEEDNLQFLLRIKNEGQIDSNVLLKRPTFDNLYISNINLIGSNFDESFELAGKTIFMSDAIETKIPTEIISSKLSQSQDTRNEDINFVACYDYETKFDSDVCVDTDVYGVKNIDRVCSVSEKSFSKGQGAPIEVKKLNLYFRKRDQQIVPIIEFELRNSGLGNILTQKGYDVLCSSSPNSNEGSLNNIIYLEELKFSSYNLDDFECGEIIFNDNVANFRCELKESSQGFNENAGNFLAKLEASFSYYYQNSKSISLRIKKN